MKSRTLGVARWFVWPFWRTFLCKLAAGPKIVGPPLKITKINHVYGSFNWFFFFIARQWHSIQLFKGFDGLAHSLLFAVWLAASWRCRFSWIQIRWVRWIQLVEHRSFAAVSLCYCYFMLFPLVHLVPSWVFSGYAAVGVLGQEGMTVLTVARLNKDILNYFAWVVSACEACKPGDLIDVAVIQHIVPRWYSLQGPIGSPARRMFLSISMDTTDPDIMTDDCAVTALSAGGFLDYALLHLLCAGWCHGLRRWSSEACRTLVTSCASLAPAPWKAPARHRDRKRIG